MRKVLVFFCFLVMQLDGMDKRVESEVQQKSLGGCSLREPEDLAWGILWKRCRLEEEKKKLQKLLDTGGSFSYTTEWYGVEMELNEKNTKKFLEFVDCESALLPSTRELCRDFSRCVCSCLFRWLCCCRVCCWRK